MCGIAGSVGLDSSVCRVEAVRRMMDALVRRGPDSEGLHEWPQAAFGHRRLAILDLSPAGHQPMLSADGEIGVVFNGCIYNFLDLRADLERHGCRFRSHCDTEILIHGYEQWGVDELLRRLRGMFAFAIWDNRRRRLTLARDRLGVKPLVYTMRDGNLVFASTVTALQRAGLAGDLDPQAVLEFLEFGWISNDRTIYQNVHKLPPATVLEWQDGRSTSRTFWRLPPAGSRTLPFEQAVEATEQLLIEAARLRLVADVPLGALLSSGIDSSLVCWALSKLKAPITAFTVSTPGDPADEADAASQTARALGIPHRSIVLPPSEQPNLDTLIAAYGEPFACSSALAMLRVCQAVKPHATVLLTGDGGDDVFLGYEHHRNFFTAQKLARVLPPFAAPLWRAFRGLPSRVPLLRRAVSLADYATGGLGAVTARHDGLPFYQDLLGPRLQELRLPHRQIPWSHGSARHLLRDFLDYEYRTRFVAEYMTKVDGGAMHWAIEARSPFLDHLLWELAAGLDYETRLHGGQLKAVLRTIARRRIDAAVAKRRKQGFTVPVGRWLVSNWRPQLEALRDGNALEAGGWIAAGRLASVVTNALKRSQAPIQLWYLVVLEHWMRAQPKPS